MGELKILDFSKVMERLEGDAELFHELVAIFVETYASTLSEIEKAITNNDDHGVMSQAHAIKGALGNIGAAKAQKVSLDLEQAGKHGSKDLYVTLSNDLSKEVAAYLAEYNQNKAMLKA